MNLNQRIQSVIAPLISANNRMQQVQQTVQQNAVQTIGLVQSFSSTPSDTNPDASNEQVTVNVSATSIGSAGPSNNTISAFVGPTQIAKGAPVIVVGGRCIQ